MHNTLSLMLSRLLTKFTELAEAQSTREFHNWGQFIETDGTEEQRATYAQTRREFNQPRNTRVADLEYKDGDGVSEHATPHRREMRPLRQSALEARKTMRLAAEAVERTSAWVMSHGKLINTDDVSSA